MKRVRVDENLAKSLKDRLKFFFELQGMKKLETERYKITVAGNGGKQALEVNTIATELPEEFQKIVVEADADKIRDAIADGKEVKGCKLLPRGTHLRIN